MARCAITHKICHVVFEKWTDDVKHACPIGRYECENVWENPNCKHFGEVITGKNLKILSDAQRGRF